MVVLNILPISLNKLPILKVCAKHISKAKYHKDLSIKSPHWVFRLLPTPSFSPCFECILLFILRGEGKLGEQNLFKIPLSICSKCLLWRAWRKKEITPSLVTWTNQMVPFKGSGPGGRGKQRRNSEPLKHDCWALTLLAFSIQRQTSGTDNIKQTDNSDPVFINDKVRRSMCRSSSSSVTST